MMAAPGNPRIGRRPPRTWSNIIPRPGPASWVEEEESCSPDGNGRSRVSFKGSFLVSSSPGRPPCARETAEASTKQKAKTIRLRDLVDIIQSTKCLRLGRFIHCGGPTVGL